jgi:Tol biopolymer transport system component
MNADGSGVTQLTPSGLYNDYEPAWSPDGTRLAFTSTRDTPFFDIWIMNADGSGVTRLTDSRPASFTTLAYNGAPAWCGDRIAFYGIRGPTRDDYNEIYVMNADGTGVTRLTFSAASDHSPTWSPTCDRIAFVSNRDGNNEIYVINADGTGETRLTDNTASDVDPAWSPDGASIAFSSNRDGNSEIYVMNVDGTNVGRLTDNAAADQRPAWSPDGTHIAFTTTRDGTAEIYIMSADGTGLIRVTDGSGDRAAWQP